MAGGEKGLCLACKLHLDIRISVMSINIYGAYTRLRDNSKSAMMAAIEIYNKPNFEYREECCVILLINAWELILKALLSKNKVRIYYYKKSRNEDYRTLSIRDSLTKGKSYFPHEMDYTAVKANLDHLITFRDKAIHFYNVKGLESVIYNLAQASINNYCDLLRLSFNVDLAESVNIVLLPLSVGQMPIDPIQFIDGRHITGKYPAEVTSFLRSLGAAVSVLEARNADVSRLMLTFSIKYESVKKRKDAVAVVGIDENAPTSVAIRKFDPNDFLRQSEILAKLPDKIEGVKVNQYTFQAYVWKHKIKEKSHLYWSDKSGAVTRYSPELVGQIRKSSGADLQKARKEYSRNQSSKSRAL